MEFLKISQISLIIIFPILIFLIAADFSVFDLEFYKKEFSAYGAQQEIPDAISMHHKVADFLKGKTNALPKELNQREKRHLQDVRRLVQTFNIALYSTSALFLSVFFASWRVLKPKNHISGFAGKVFLFGGSFTIFLAGALLLLINSSFESTFESFHGLLFEKGTYLFDPGSEIIVRLYPEPLFMDLGIRISEIALFSSLIGIFIGIFLMSTSKNKKIKKG